MREQFVFVLIGLISSIVCLFLTFYVPFPCKKSFDKNPSRLVYKTAFQIQREDTSRFKTRDKFEGHLEKSYSKIFSDVAVFFVYLFS